MNTWRRVVGATTRVVMTLGGLMACVFMSGEVVAKNAGDLGPWRGADELIQSGDVPAPIAILEVNLQFDADKTPPLRVKKLTIKQGYAPNYDPVSDGYVLSLHGGAGEILSTMSFQIPNRVSDPPPQTGDVGDGNPVIRRAMDFSLTVPMLPDAVELRVTDPQGLQLITESLRDIPVKHNRPKFRSPRHKKSSPATSSWRTIPQGKSRWATWLEGLMPSVEAATTDGTALDIVFVGDKYTSADLLRFQQDVDRVVAHLLTYEPYASRSDQIHVHSVDNTTVDLGCVHDTMTNRLITCNDTAVVSVVNDAGAPYDKIIVLVNDPNYGGSGGSIAVSYNGDSAPQVVVHEFGHSLGNLLDEYNLYSSNGSTDGGTYANCYAGTPPDATWNGLATPTDYAGGCKFPNWYRSSSCSIMLSLGCQYFNVVSQRLLSAKLDFFAGSVTPTLMLNATPELIKGGGTTILSWSTTRATACTASGGWGGDKPVSGSETLTPSASASFVLACKNALGSTSHTVIVTVDTQPPTVTLTSPAAGSTLSGKVTLTASASDDQRVERVEFYKDTLLFGATNAAPFTMIWNTARETNGAHTLMAQAIDGAGNMSATAPVSVVTSNVVDTQAPVVVLLNPVDSSTVIGRVRIKATATDNIGVVRQELYIDGALRASSTTGNLNYAWDSGRRIVPSGTHILIVNAMDAADNIGTASATVFKK